MDVVWPTVGERLRPSTGPGRCPNSVLAGMSWISKGLTICPKCGKPSWAPYIMEVVKKYGQVYRYKVYRHPDGRRRTPRKCTVRILSTGQGPPEEMQADEGSQARLFTLNSLTRP